MVKQGQINVVNVFLRDMPQFTPEKCAMIDGARANSTAGLRYFDGNLQCALSRASSIEIDVPDETHNKLTNHFYEDPCRMHDIVDGPVRRG